MHIKIKDYRNAAAIAKALIKELIPQYDKAQTYKTYYMLHDTLNMLDKDLDNFQIDITTGDGDIHYLRGHNFKRLEIGNIDIAHFNDEEIKTLFNTKVYRTFLFGGESDKICINFCFNNAHYPVRLYLSLDGNHYIDSREVNSKYVNDYVAFVKGFMERINLEVILPM